jgi:hypothetical protein
MITGDVVYRTVEEMSNLNVHCYRGNVKTAHYAMSVNLGVPGPQHIAVASQHRSSIRLACILVSSVVLLMTLSLIHCSSSNPASVNGLQ